MTRRLLLYLYGTPNIVGSLLGLSGLGLFFAGAIHRFWLPIVVGLYLLGVVATPRRRVDNLAIEHVLTEDELRRALEGLLRKIKGKLSEPVMARLTSIKENLMALLPSLERFDGSSHQLHVVHQTVTVYLPKMLETYLSLPPAYARLHTVKDGKTPRDVLLDQLTLLDEELKQILNDTHRADSDALFAHGRFLETKFARGQDWLG